jgi:hypothetical protein
MGVLGALSTQDIDKAKKFLNLYVEADKFATKLTVKTSNNSGALGCVATNWRCRCRLGRFRRYFKERAELSINAALPMSAFVFGGT